MMSSSSKPKIHQPLPAPKDCCVMVTGGAGFIGSAVIRRLIADGYATIINVDILTYAGNESTVAEESGYLGYRHERVDIRHAREIRELVHKYQPDAVMHLAAESHVDRSIDGPEEFISTNIHGTYNLLAATKCEIDESDALHIAEKELGFDIGPCSAQLMWRGLRSRPVWRILGYSSEPIPSQRAVLLIDANTAEVLEAVVEENPEDWDASTKQTA